MLRLYFDGGPLTHLLSLWFIGHVVLLVIAVRRPRRVPTAWLWASVVGLMLVAVLGVVVGVGEAHRAVASCGPDQVEAMLKASYALSLDSLARGCVLFVPAALASGVVASRRGRALAIRPSAPLDHATNQRPH